MRIDSHQHFWHYDPVSYSWIDDEMQVIKRDFLPTDLHPVLAANQVDGCVAVQADQTEEETQFLLKLAEQNDFIKGVVGWVDLRAANIEERLPYFAGFPKLKGFRHVLQGEAQDDFMLREDFLRGIAALEKHSFTYDILIHPKHLPYALELASRFPNQPFVIDHIAKPFIKAGIIEPWAEQITALAALPNVQCKISGMVTEADWRNWKPGDFEPYVQTVLKAFGPNRVMFGSDWPVCLVAAQYAQVCALLQQNIDHYTPEEQAAIWGNNAQRFYHL